MELFPSSNKDIFRRTIFKNTDDYDELEAPSMKGRLGHWEKATRSTKDNETALEREMGQTLAEVGDFLKRLEILVTVHSRRMNSGISVRDLTKYQTIDSRFKDQVVLGHTLMAKVKELLELEDSGLNLSRSTQPSSTRNSHSGLGSESVNDSYDCDDISQSSRYSSELRDLLRRFNQVLKNKERCLPPQVKELEITADLKESFTVENNRDSLQFLTDKLAADNIQPVFSSLPAKPNQSTHTISCKLFNISVEGKATEKSAAKKAAAHKMLERLVDDCQQNKLPPQITPFRNLDLREAIRILCVEGRYDEELERMCKERRKVLPRYETDSSKHSLRVRCSALGLLGTGNDSNLLIAKREAAREVLMQFKCLPKY